MSYLLRTKRSSRVSKPLLFFIIVLIAIGLLIFTPLSWGMRALVHGVRGDVAVKNILNWATSKKTLIQEKEEMEQKLTELQAKYTDRDALFEENLSLKGIENLHTNDVVAAVLLHPGFSPYDTLLLSKGSDDGVELGDLAIFQSLVIGEISEVSGARSRATLFSSSGKSFPVRIGKDRIEAEAKGLGGGSFEVLLPKNVDVAVGDAVLLAANSLHVFGSVLDKEVESDDVFQRILFALPININSIDFVTIEKKEL